MDADRSPTAGSGGAPDPSAGGVVLLKLGGSLITVKGQPDTARPERIRRLAAEIAAELPRLEEGLVIGHGSGSYGHVAAARHAIGEGPVRPEARGGIVETQERAAALHCLVVAALREAGVPALSVSPSSTAIAAAGRLAEWNVEPVGLALGAGLVPVVYGDVVLDRAHGAAILSTETLLEALAARLEKYGWRAVRALWAGDTNGVLDQDGRPIRRVRSDAPGAALRAAGGATATDVTGGMAHRLETALRLAERGVPSWIGDGREEGGLGRALRDRAVGGTRVQPSRRAGGQAGGRSGGQAGGRG